MGHLLTAHGLAPDPDEVAAITKMPPSSRRKGAQEALRHGQLS